MDHLEVAQEILDSMLGYLGFPVQVEIDTNTSTLNVASGNAKLLIGHHGDRLEEIQYLVNRLLQDRLPEAPKVRVDIDNYLASRDYRMVEEAEAGAARVIATGQTVKLAPMNSYQRRLIHNHFKDHPEVKTWSPSDSARLKRISLIPKNPVKNAQNTEDIGD
ncbi:MAG: single-stranded DNA-binding protein [Verrucomicrobiales bacterium]|nr:single-stranded DNA-binding protein [Verrucomicrobiales bacterium]